MHETSSKTMLAAMGVSIENTTPVQNSKSSKLTFKLGGVNPVAGTGATVTYGVAVVDSPSETAEPTQYVGVGESIELDVPTTVKYYRIKTKIDQTQANN